MVRPSPSPFRSSVTLPIHVCGGRPSQPGTDRRIGPVAGAIALPNRRHADHNEKRQSGRPVESN
jgi:hypothetical protein